MLNKLKNILKNKGNDNDFKNQYLHHSYSQVGEDIIVEFIFKHILKQNEFTYMDVGAHHPFYLSNTALFYEKGFKGISIEPDPNLCSLIKKYRTNEVCLNIGIMFNEVVNIKQEIDFYVMSATTLNTFSKEEAERLDNEGTYKITDIKKIEVQHLHSIFKKYFLPDFLSIDVEGLDIEIIKSIDFVKYRPKVICVETIQFSPKGNENIKNYDIINYLKEMNYYLYADTNINSIFIDNNFFLKI